MFIKSFFFILLHNMHFNDKKMKENYIFISAQEQNVCFMKRKRTEVSFMKTTPIKLIACFLITLH